MTLSLRTIAIRNDEILLPKQESFQFAVGNWTRVLLSRLDVVTIMSNIVHYGYALDTVAVRGILSLSPESLRAWWAETETSLKSETFSDRGMADFVVYKNFPKEVIEKSAAEYWIPQILMYLGVEPEVFSQTPEVRKEKRETPELHVLKGVQISEQSYAESTFQNLVQKTKSWTDPETETAQALLRMLPGQAVNISSFGFRGNGVLLAKSILETGISAEISARDATDVLRLAQALAPVAKKVYRPSADFGQKASRPKRARTEIGNLSRAHRRLLCDLLEASHDLEGDVARRPAAFKVLMQRLRPGEFCARRVQSVYDDIYNKRIKGAQADVENAVRAEDPETALSAVSKLPAGARLRRFRKLYALQPDAAVKICIDALPEVDTGTVLSLVANLKALNALDVRIATPKGEWSKMQILENQPGQISADHLEEISMASRDLISKRMKAVFPNGIRRLPDFSRLQDIKLPENGQAFASYGRGTTFPLPEGPGFLRSASYWENKGHGNSWFDNGMTFLTEDFSAANAVCWNNVSETQSGVPFAVFSGDPTNAKELKGRACQMLDVYPENRRAWRYALWNVLCFSGIKFSEATGEVLATLQVGADPQSGQLYEPSRAMFAFKLERPANTSYVAVVDMAENQIVYLDVDLGGSVHSAVSNLDWVRERLPAVLKVMSFRPSWHDLLSCVPEGPEGVPVGYADAGVCADQALCFSQEDPEAEYSQMSLQALLATKGSGEEPAFDVSLSPEM